MDVALAFSVCVGLPARTGIAVAGSAIVKPGKSAALTTPSSAPLSLTPNPARNAALPTLNAATIPLLSIGAIGPVPPMIKRSMSAFKPSPSANWRIVSSENSEFFCVRTLILGLSGMTHSAPDGKLLPLLAASSCPERLFLTSLKMSSKPLAPPCGPPWRSPKRGCSDTND